MLISKIYENVEEIPKIPLNSTKFFLIEKSKNGKYCIDIKFNIYEKIYIKNLYYILKSYLNNTEVICISISLCGETDNGNIVIENIKPNKIKKMTIDDFENGIKYRILSDKKYDPNKTYIYCIKLIFSSIFIEKISLKLNTNILERLFPIYPGKIISEKKKNINEKINRLIKKYKFLKFL